jgi:hypothetical protein
MTTPKQIRDFALVKGGYKKIDVPPKPTHGNLYLMDALYIENMPFPLLNHKKKELLKQGYLNKQIKITY